MNSSTAGHQWSQPEQQIDTMATHMSNELDDLGDLFEFGDIDLNTTPSVEPMSFNHMQQSQPGTHPNTPFAELSESAVMPNTLAQDFGTHDQFGLQNMDQQHQYIPQDGMQAQTTMSYPADSMYQPAMQQQQQQYPSNDRQKQFQFSQQHQHHQSPFPPGRNGIPPTPNSFEMHGESGHFLQQPDQLDPQQRFMLEQRYNVRKDDAIAYTPLASPAGTPQYNIQSDFTVPGAYFSPLTSPMIHAQRNAHQQQHISHAAQQGYYTNPNTAPSSVAPSPIDPSGDVDMLGDGMILPDSATSARKSKRKVSTPRTAGAGARVRQSPIQKPQQKRKSATLSTLIPPEEIDDIMSEAQQSGRVQPQSAIAHIHAAISGSSEDGSISPEPLSESLMGPPPRPTTSRIQSPAITALQLDARNAAGAAATPKSILSRRNHQQSSSAQASPMMSQHNAMEHGGLEDLQLPESASGAAAHRPPLTHLDTSLSSTSGEQTPRLSARKTPKLGPLSSPAGGKPSVTMASPSISGSPMIPGTPGSFLAGKSDAKRNSKKRGSVSTTSAHVSPAIRPRISPSIKPLLPEGTSLNSPTHALLLASKSNYQNLLEGNHLPGVTYPDSLSTGLTSKRTSHKVAEQGRRNRINEALKEMQGLLPKPSATSKSSSPANNNKDSGGEGNADAAGEEGTSKNTKETNEEAQARSNNSKAATVESANEYIRLLQKENAEKTANLLLLQKECADMKKKLHDKSAEASSSSGSSASPPAAKVKA